MSAFMFLLPRRVKILYKDLHRWLQFLSDSCLSSRRLNIYILYLVWCETSPLQMGDVCWVGVFFSCSISSWTLLKTWCGVIVPWHLWVFLYLWCLLCLNLAFFPFTWIIPLFLLLFLQMTPLVSKKMDQFLGESWGCLFIITIHGVKTEPCWAELCECFGAVLLPGTAACPFPIPWDHPSCGWQAFMDVEAELDEWTGLI